MKILVRALVVLGLLLFAVPAAWYFAHNEPWTACGQLGAVAGIIFLWAWYEERHR